MFLQLLLVGLCPPFGLLTSPPAKDEVPVPLEIVAAEDEPQVGGEEPPSNRGFGLVWADSGIGFGNSRRLNGLRFNFRDDAVECVQGLNVTLWHPGKNTELTLRGVAIGTYGPEAARLTGAGLGLAAVLVHERLTGLGTAGVGILSTGTLEGIHLAGIAVSAESMLGLSAGGIVTVGSGRLTGLNFGGLALVSKESRGLNVGGIASFASEKSLGLNVAGMATVSNGSLAGVSLAGLAVCGSKTLTGVSVAGAVVGSGGEPLLEWLGGEPTGPGDATLRGIAVAGYRVQAAEIEGVAVGGLVVRAHRMTGLSVGTVQLLAGRQTGLSIGIVNATRDLRGVQLGLVNIVTGRAFPGNVLPLVNAGFD